MQLAYWIAESNCGNAPIRALSRKAVRAEIETRGEEGNYHEARRVVLEYASGFALLNLLLGDTVNELEQNGGNVDPENTSTVYKTGEESMDMSAWLKSA
jgi:hypothetical protein